VLKFKKKYTELLDKFKVTGRTKNLIDLELDKIKSYQYETINIEVDGEVKGQARHRVGHFKNLYDPDKKYKIDLSDRIVFLISKKYGKKISSKKIKGKLKLKRKISNDISVTIIHYKSIPKSFSMKNRILCLLQKIKVNTTPDVDNLTKLVLDTLTLSVIKDDRFLWKTKIIKKWAETPKCIIKIKYRI